MNIYFTYRQNYTDRGVKQDISFYNDKMYQDFKDAWITKMIDWERFIPTSQITKETVPWIKSLRKWWVLEYSIPELWPELTESLRLVAQSFWIKILTSLEMIEWIKDYTRKTEIEPWKFLISEVWEYTMWELIPDRYLIIK